MSPCRLIPIQNYLLVLRGGAGRVLARELLLIAD